MGCRNWPLSLFIVFLFSIFLVGVFMPPEERICSLVLQIEAARQANTPVFGCLEFWLNRYQTTIASLIALGAAILSAIFLHKQISVSERHESDRLSRQNTAARAMLQISLDAICAYSKRSAKILFSNLEVLDPYSQDWNGPIPIVDPPIKALEQMQRLIETLPVNQINAFSDLIGKIQVHQARIETLTPTSGATSENLKHFIVDAVEIHAISSKMFSYARRYEDNISNSISRIEIISFLHLLQVKFEMADEFIDKMTSRFS